MIGSIRTILAILVLAPLMVSPLGCSRGAPLAPGSADGGGIGTLPDGDSVSVDLAPAVEYPYPAPHPAMPQVVNHGGPVLAAPQFVAVTFDGDPMRDQLEAFLQSVGATEYWKAISAEYGVGAGTYAGAIHLAGPAPAELSDGTSVNTNMTETISAWLASQLDGSHSEWIAPVEDSTLYVLFYPDKTTINLVDSQGVSKSCEGFGAYHSQALLPSGNLVPYAVVPRCGQGRGSNPLGNTTVSTTHELVEAATDPYPAYRPAYTMVDDDHYAWSATGGGEVADLCQQLESITPTDYGYTVPRSWSNAAAKAGHNPCVPAPDAPYFNAGIEVKDRVTTTSGKVGGVRIAVGETKTVEVVLFSDRPTDEWTVSIGGFHRNNNLTTSFDRDSGKNGDKLKLTITVNKANTGRFGAGMVMLVSTLDNRTTSWPFFVGQ